MTLPKVHTTLSLTILILLSFGFASATPNGIKLGNASIEINVSGDKDSVENLRISLGHQHLFAELARSDYSSFKDNGNGNYTLEIPAETHRVIASLRIANQANDKTYAAGTVELNQDSTLVLNCELSEAGFKVTPSSTFGFNRYTFDVGKNPGLTVQNKLVPTFYDNQYKAITQPRKIYAAGDSAWHEVLRQMEETYLPLLNDPDLTEGLEQREGDIVRSNLAYYIYGMKYLPYDHLRQKYAPYGNRETPPLEYYDFLNRIDYSHLTDTYFFVPPTFLLSRMLIDLPVGIEPIGETPVREWQRQTAEKLGKVIKEFPDELPRLLSAASYNMQFGFDRKPLTPTQIKNITEGYDDDLGKIILNKNEQLKAELGNTNTK